MQHARGGNDDVLPAIDFIRRRRRASSPRQRRGPQFVAGRFVKGANLVVSRAGNKQQPARRHDGAAVVFGPRVRHSLGRQFRIFPKRLFPQQPACVQIDTIKRSPRRFVGWIAFLIVKTRVTGATVHGTFRLRRRPGVGAVAQEKIVRQRLEFFRAQFRVRRHRVLAVADLFDNRLLPHPLPQAAQRRIQADAQKIGAVARGACRLEDFLSGRLGRVWVVRRIIVSKQADRPANVIGRHVHTSRFRVHAFAGPFRPAVNVKVQRRVPFTDWPKPPVAHALEERTRVFG
jgi:hypothetical protein